MDNRSETSEELGALRPFEEYLWATRLPLRDGGKRIYKRHKTLGHAKLAVSGVNGSNASGAVIYRWDHVENTWLLAYHVNVKRELQKYTA